MSRGRHPLIGKQPPSDLDQRVQDLIASGRPPTLGRLLGLNQAQLNFVSDLNAGRIEGRDDILGRGQFDAPVWQQAIAGERLHLEGDGGLLLGGPQSELYHTLSRTRQRSLLAALDTIGQESGQPLLVCWPRPSPAQIRAMPAGWSVLVVPDAVMSWTALTERPHRLLSFERNVCSPSRAMVGSSHKIYNNDGSLIGQACGRFFIINANPLAANRGWSGMAEEFASLHFICHNLRRLLGYWQQQRGPTISIAEVEELRQQWHGPWRAALALMSAFDDDMLESLRDIGRRGRQRRETEKKIDSCSQQLRDLRQQLSQLEQYNGDLIRNTIQDRLQRNLIERATLITDIKALPAIADADWEDGHLAVVTQPLVIASAGERRLVAPLLIRLPLNGPAIESIEAYDREDASHPACLGPVSLIDHSGASLAFAQHLGHGDLVGALRLLLGLLTQPLGSAPVGSLDRWPLTQQELGWQRAMSPEPTPS